MDNTIIALWAFAVFFASVFASVIVMITLERKYNRIITIAGWVLAGAIGYAAAFFSYKQNIGNDFVGIVGLSVIVCIATVFLYNGSFSTKLFMACSASLIANVCTFMFCGTTDSLLAGRLGLIKESPYEVPNLLFFIGIKLVVYAIIFVLYNHFLKKTFNDTFEALKGKLGWLLAAPIQAFIAFYIINLFTNTEGIFPGTTWFFPLYSMICLTFVIEYVLLFNSVLWSAKAMKTSAELDVAKNIQSSALPHEFNAFPEFPNINLFASMNTAKEVGGDFYDFFKIGDNKLAVVIADVSGKGVPAAMFMMRAKTIIRSYAETGQPIEEVMTKANDSLCQYNAAQMFVTVWAAVIDIETGLMSYVNGGHNPPLIRKKDGSFEYLKMKVNFVLGSFEGIPYRRQEYQLEPGDTLYLYTDGVTEAMNVDNQLYGEDRLQKCLNQKTFEKADSVVDAVREDVARFTVKAEQSDDITMLSVFYN